MKGTNQSRNKTINYRPQYRLRQLTQESGWTDDIRDQSRITTTKEETTYVLKTQKRIDFLSSESIYENDVRPLNRIFEDINR